MAKTKEKFRDLPIGYLSGFKIAYSSTTQIVIGTSGKDSICRSDTDSDDIELSGTLTLDLSTTGNNGLDTGSRSADTWYDIYVTKGSSGVGSIAVISGNSPSLASGYDSHKRRVGAIVTKNSGTDIVLFGLTGGSNRRLWQLRETLSEQTLLNNGSQTTFTALDPTTALIPDGVEEIQLAITGRFDTTTPIRQIQLRAKGSASSGGTFNLYPGAVDASATDEWRWAPFFMSVGDSSQIEYRFSGSAANIAAWIYVTGFWMDL